MNETLQAIKDVFATLENLGWHPIPIAAAIIGMVGARSYWEPSVLQVTTPDELRRMGKIKCAIFGGVSVLCALLQVGLSKPANSFEWALSIGFSLMDAMAGYVVSSSSFVRDYFKNTLFKGGANVQNPPAS